MKSVKTILSVLLALIMLLSALPLTVFAAETDLAEVDSTDSITVNVTSFLNENDGVSITTLGKGHRVGMSQSGAQAMAKRGYGYQTILTYYYPGAVIDKLENMG